MKTDPGNTAYKIGIVVLAYNHVDDTLECLHSLSQISYSKVDLILVDNGSTDGTSTLVAERFPEATVLRLDPNEGIARGYNHGIRYSLKRGADFVVVLNNDTVVGSDFLEKMVQTYERHEDVGIVMPMIYYYGSSPTRVWSAGARWRSCPPSIKSIGAGRIDGSGISQECEIDFAPSCCLLIERRSLERIGLFDPEYFFYFDDYDLCERFRSAGKKIYLSPMASVWHKVALSTLKTDPPAEWWRVMGISSVRFFLKHKSRFTLYAHTGWITLRECLKGGWRHVPAYLEGVRQGLRETKTYQ